MKLILAAVLASMSLFLFSCQKELDIDLGNGSAGGSTNGTRLVKTVSKTGSDSLSTNYTYISSGKLSGYASSGIQSSQPVDISVRLVRNGSGIVQQSITKSSIFLAFGIDSLITSVNYDAANNRYKNTITNISFFGLLIRDSLAFQYNSSGKLDTQIDYQDDGTGSGYAPVTKTVYTYSGNNLASQKNYSYNSTSSAWDLAETDSFEYDSKVNPLQLGIDASLISMTGFYSANNVVKTTLVDAVDPTNNSVTDDTYTYNSANRPATGIGVSSGTTTAITFFYQ